MSLRRPLRMTKAQLSTARERNAVTRGMEAMFGDVREAKGILEPVYEKERTHVRRTDITSEWQHQATVVAWWDKIGSRELKLPTYALFSVPNGAALSGGAGSSANLQRAGMRKGIPDLMLAIPRNGKPGLFIECKREDGRLSEQQIEVQAFLALQGYQVATCYSADSAIAAILGYVKT